MRENYADITATNLVVAVVHPVVAAEVHPVVAAEVHPVVVAALAWKLIFQETRRALCVPVCVLCLSVA